MLKYVKQYECIYKMIPCYYICISMELFTQCLQIKSIYLSIYSQPQRLQLSTPKLGLTCRTHATDSISTCLVSHFILCLKFFHQGINIHITGLSKGVISIWRNNNVTMLTCICRRKNCASWWSLRSLLGGTRRA